MFSQRIVEHKKINISSIISPREIGPLDMSNYLFQTSLRTTVITWPGALISLICAWTNGWANNRDAVDLRRHRDYYDVSVMVNPQSTHKYALPLFPKLINTHSKRKGMWQGRSYMMTSSNGNIFRVTGPLCGEVTGPGEFPLQWPVTRSFDALFDLRLNKQLSKQPWGWWFEMPSWSLWRHRNGCAQGSICFPFPWLFHIKVDAIKGFLVKCSFPTREKIQANQTNKTKLALGVEITVMWRLEPLPSELKINICTNLLRSRKMILDCNLYSIVQFHTHTKFC